ncbi:coatomer subunit delta-1 isoform X7 [Arachis hypogaea]|uniref:coatomer subunit delta-1 isoform X7 n=1 Tax=Arachis hypogaea TaxID=3818 RepID=UPI003B21108D
MNMHQKMRLTLFYHHMLLSRSKKVQPSLFRQHFMRLMFFHTLLRVTLQLVPEYSDYFEESICKCAFDLILISLGHKENVTVTQVKQYCEMESHEEKLHRQMREDKIREAKDEMKRKANEIDKNKIGYSKVDILCSESGKQRIILMDQKSQEASILPSSLRSSRKNEAIHKLGC